MARLTIGDYALLAGYGDAVRAAHSDAARDEAIAVVVYTCGRYHTRGIPWTSLAVAVGETTDTLRRWRRTHAPDRKDPGAADRAAIAINLRQRHPTPSNPAER